MNETFPFGQPILKVEQRNKHVKKAFVLGVYASAVHATWFSPKGKIYVRALGIASEPEIFWRGENASEIVSKIEIPQACGYLLSAEYSFNGPSGRALDRLYLYPLKLSREDVWLCDLLPRSRMNNGQCKAIDRVYTPYVKKGLLPPINWPPVKEPFADDVRRKEIVEELKESKAEVLILLGDKPIEEFLKYYHTPVESLSKITKKGKEYGKTFRALIEGYSVNVLPLVHPRQAAQLGTASKGWGKIHNKWVHDCLTISKNIQPTRKRIVYLDDDDNTRECVAKVLYDGGYIAYTIDSKADGYNWIILNKPDLVISDIASPGVNGFELLEMLKSNPNTRDIPFVFLTGFSDKVNEITLKAKRMGAADFLSKPPIIADLLRTIKRVLLESGGSPTYQQSKKQAVAKKSRLLLIADEMGPYFKDLFQTEGLEVNIVASYGRIDVVYDELTRIEYDMIILTNNSLMPEHIVEFSHIIRSKIPKIKILVLSGYTTQEFISQLQQNLIDGFFSLPSEVDNLVLKVKELLSI